MPDLKESTNHLAPLTLPAQIGLYFPGREGRLGVQVRKSGRLRPVSFLPSKQLFTQLWNRILLKRQSSAQSAFVSGTGLQPTFQFNGASVSYALSTTTKGSPSTLRMAQVPRETSSLVPMELAVSVGHQPLIFCRGFGYGIRK